MIPTMGFRSVGLPACTLSTDRELILKLVVCHYRHRCTIISFVYISDYRNPIQSAFSRCSSVCYRSGSESSWSWYQSVLWVRMEHLWLHSDTLICMWSDCAFLGTFICVRGDPSTTSAAAAVQVEETLQRRVWDSSSSLTTYVFNCNCHAGSVLLLCHHWHGAVCRLWHAELLCVSTSFKYCSL